MNTNMTSRIINFIEADKYDPLTVESAYLSDKFCQDKLRSLGIRVSKTSLEKLTRKAHAVEEITEHFISKIPEYYRSEKENNWVYRCVLELWRRWFPDNICFELIAVRVENIYDLLSSDNISAACRVWHKTWPLFIEYFDKCETTSINDFKKRFPKYKVALFWLADISSELACQGGEMHYLRERIEFCETILRRLSPHGECDGVIEAIRDILTGAYMTLGETEKVDSLFRQWIEDNPVWTTGFMFWANCYDSFSAHVDLEKAERILRDGVAYIEQAAIVLPDEGKRRHELMEVLAMTLHEQGKCAEAERIWRDYPLTMSLSLTQAWHEYFSEFKRFTSLRRLLSPNSIIPIKKFGRKDLCPCESGRRFKRCCGQL